MVQLTEPLEMFNAYVVDFSCSVGYGAESSTMQMTLAEDPDHVDSNGNSAPKIIQHKKPRLDEDGKLIPDNNGSVEYDIVSGFPEVGTCCQFKFEGFEFVGIFQRYNYNQSLSGNTYDITFESPSKALDGTQVILDKFEGTVFTEGNRYFPSEGENFTSQINNIYNPFGIKENYAFGGLFGGSGRNEFGFDARELLEIIEGISRSEYTYDNPSGASVDASTNSDDEEIIGGPIHFGESKFVIDFAELKTLVPDFLRIKGDFQSINAILQECTEIIVHDYVSYIKPTETQVLVGYGRGINPQPIYRTEVQNGVTLPTLDDDENVTGPVISFKYLNKSAQPNPGVVESLVNAKKGTTLISATNGKELADVVTQKLIIGDKATRVWHAGLEYMIPVYGKDLAGEWLVGAGFGDTDIAPVLMPNGATYNAYIAELRAALSGFDVWCWYHTVGAAYGYTNVTNPTYSSFARISQSKFNKVIQNTMTPYAIMSSFNGDHMRAMAQNEAQMGLNGSVDGDNTEVFQAVLNTATNYYGKTYFILLPVEPGGIDNNIRFVKEKSESAWQISESGWDPDFTIKDIDGYDDTGKMKAAAGYFPSFSTSTKEFSRDFSEIERPLPYVIPNLATVLVGATNITVDKKIYWRQNPYFQQNNNPYDDVSAMVHVTVPAVYEHVNGGLMQSVGFDKQLVSGPRAAMDGIFAFAAGLGPGSALGSATGFSGYGTEPSNFLSMENAALALKYMPKAVRPYEISIPQSSTRYTWGPWYRYSAKRGKAEIEQNSQLNPETFGSVNVLDQAAFALAGSAVADMYQSESGSIEVAEFPEYNIAERFTGSGPYVTKLSCKVGTGGITTSYEFSTWTRNFGKIAKYNVDRIAAINKNKIRALRQGSNGIPMMPFQGSSTIGAGAQNAHALNPQVNNFFTGIPVPMNVAGGAANNPDGPQVWLMSGKNGESVAEDLVRKIQFGNNILHAYDVTFGCTQEQILSPIGVPSTRQRVETGQHYGGIKDFLPYIKDPKDAEDSTGDKFSFNLVNPSAADLDPYFGPKSYDGWGKVDYGVTVVDDFATVSQGRNFMAFEDRNNTSEKSNEYRTYGLRGPILLSGWGYDVDGLPVPRGERDLPDQFNGSFSQNRSGWKTGPVDLRWDEERQVWAGGYQIVEGFLTTPVKPAIGQNPDGESTVQIYKRIDGTLKATGEEIKVKNLDKHLEITQNLPLYVSCIRINRDWRFLYIGCDVPAVQ